MPDVDAYPIHLQLLYHISTNLLLTERRSELSAGQRRASLEG